MVSNLIVIVPGAVPHAYFFVLLEIKLFKLYTHNIAMTLYKIMNPLRIQKISLSIKNCLLINHSNNVYIQLNQVMQLAEHNT